MNFETKYNAGLECIQEILSGAGDSIKTSILRKRLQPFFPELAESEDEGIRKALIEYFRIGANNNEITCNIEDKKILAWLEKQVGQQTSLPKWRYKRDDAPLLRDSLVLNKYGCVLKAPSGAIISDAWVLDYYELTKLPKEEPEKQDEQKVVDSSQACKMETLMTLDEAIEHCKEKSCDDTACAKEHKQLAEWLTELKGYRVQEAQNTEPVNKSKFHPGDIVQYITDSTDRRKIEEIDTFCNMYHTDSSPIMFEVEDEWKVVVNAEDVESESANKVEPMFHPGDWVINTNNRLIWEITSIRNSLYYIRDINGNEGYETYDGLQDNYRLWAIADAANGDVLVNEETGEPFIYNGNRAIYFSGYFLGAHCGICNGVFNQLGNNHYWGKNSCPATKEQRDLLFKTMAEAGYEWNEKSKALKKIDF